MAGRPAGQKYKRQHDSALAALPTLPGPLLFFPKYRVAVPFFKSGYHIRLNKFEKVINLA
jgi:hypothetical protein